MILVDLFIVICGLVLGSFLFNTSYRIYQQQSLWGRSRCPNCHTKISILALIPVLGYIGILGKCQSCNQKIPIWYPGAEVLNAILLLLIFKKTGLSLDLIRYICIFEILFFIAIYDLKSMQIYPGSIILGLLIQMIWLFFIPQPEKISSIIGLLIGAGLFHWVAYIYRAIRKRDGLGDGDATLLGLVGFMMGWQSLFFIVLWASILGILGGLIIIRLNRQKIATKIAFGPWISLAAFLVWWKPTLFNLNIVLENIF
ncbi:MAG: prepilin peptidase [Deltaproteobacteria bacterium]|jgi:leader peptidase (prepilin peptidase) / N-methyltransferase|nr:prepilin peptidase [Deltaproteobacteria bacterium]MBT4525969.1 prepilin peptidase [Deltaproteobacteria bacterium]